MFMIKGNSFQSDGPECHQRSCGKFLGLSGGSARWNEGDRLCKVQRSILLFSLQSFEVLRYGYG